MTPAWPDYVIAAILIVGAFSGFRRGFVGELTGAIALVVAIVAAFRYGGEWDGFVGAFTHLGPGSTHVLGLCLFGAFAYAVTVAFGVLLGRVAKLPLIGIANALLGACVGIVKAAVLVWAGAVHRALLPALARPAAPDLHRSTLVAFPHPRRTRASTARCARSYRGTQSRSARASSTATASSAPR